MRNPYHAMNVTEDFLPYIKFTKTYGNSYWRKKHNKCCQFDKKSLKTRLIIFRMKTQTGIQHLKAKNATKTFTQSDNLTTHKQVPYKETIFHHMG